MSNNLIDTEPGKGLALLADIVTKYRNGAISVETLDLLAKGKLVPAPGVRLAASRDPLDKLVSKIERKLSRKLGRHVRPCQPPQVVTAENLRKWAAFNMYPIFLPELDLTENVRLPKKWIRLGGWYYDKIREGKIGETFSGVLPTQIRPGWYLADFSIIANDSDETQVFPYDPWSPLFERLRREKLVDKHHEESKISLGSRSYFSHNEWNQVVLGSMASELGFLRGNLRLERASEFNMIGNIYDTYRGEYYMWVWFADPCGASDRLIGGHSSCGGLWFIKHAPCDDWGGCIAARPLVVL